MRIFITSEGSANRTRIFIEDHSTTSQLITEICKQIAANRNQIIVKLKYQPYNLVLVEDWPLEHYPIRNGSVFTVYFNFRQRSQQSLSSSINPVSQNVQDVYQSFYEANDKLSFISSNGQADDGKQLQESLNKLFDAIRGRNLEEISAIFNKKTGYIQEGEQEQRRYEYLLNELGEYGRNALHEAIQVNSLDIVSYLILKGADPTILTVDQFTPIQLAIVYRAPQILGILLQQKKVNVNQVTAHGTALHLAISNEEIKCIQILFQYDADIQAKDLDGQTAIDRSSNIQLKEFLRNRSQIKRASLPNITKGFVYSVITPTNKHKGNILIINPYKNQTIFLKQSSQIDAKFPVTLVERVQQVTQGFNQVQSNLHYLKMSLKNKQGKHVVFGVRNLRILKKWIECIERALYFREINMYVKPIPYYQQLIEVLDDASNQISVCKRDIQRYRQSRMSYNSSICHDYEIEKHSKPAYRSSSMQEQPIRPLSNKPQQRQKTSQTTSPSKIQQKKPQKLKSAQASTLKSSYSNSQQVISERQVEYRPVISDKKASSTQSQKSVSFRDFKIIKLVGYGAFGEVYSAINIKNDKAYALKVLNKKKLMSKKQLRYAVGQVSILKKVDFPFIIGLSFAFQTPLNIYLALDSCTYGDLSELITIKEMLSQETSKFITAQIILAIEYLHNRNILYRDLKPDNILIASDGYIRLTDFGLSKQDCFSMSFCGSPAYLSPQMLEKNGVGFSNDIYGIGCVLYEMVVGQPPFFDQKLDKLFENIKTAQLLFPRGISPELKSLLSSLLQRNISARIGVNDFAQIKHHIFFKGFDWNGLLSKRLLPPSQIFANDQTMNFQPQMSVEHLEEIKLDDLDYDESPEKAGRIRNFTFLKNGETSRKKL